jgi:hypothetical protein
MENYQMTKINVAQLTVQNVYIEIQKSFALDALIIPFHKIIME